MEYHKDPAWILLCFDIRLISHHQEHEPARLALLAWRAWDAQRENAQFYFYAFVSFVRFVVKLANALYRVKPNEEKALRR